MNLHETALFRGVREEEIQALLGCLKATRRHYRKGAIILMEGRTTTAIGLVLSGQVAVTSTDSRGTVSMLGHLGAGDVFAEVYACLPKQPLLVSVAAVEDSTILFMDMGRILTVCTHACPFHTRLIRNLLHICAQRTLQLSQRIQHTTPKSIRGRLLSYFGECAKRAGGPAFRIPYNRQQLADYLNVDRSALSNELSKMRRDGILEYDKRSFKMLLAPADD